MILKVMKMMSMYQQFGIDVSKYQENIDWNLVKKSGIDFAMIRLGFRGYGKEGNIVLDSKYEEHINGALQSEIKVGVYFFSQAITVEEAIEEAEFVLENIKDYEISYPVCFDTEKIKTGPARTEDLNKEQLTDITTAFCNKVKNAGYTPMIYANAKWFTTSLELEKLQEYEFWYADYQPEPIYPYNFKMWQYTENGKVNGIDGNVDINLYFKEKN